MDIKVHGTHHLLVLTAARAVLVVDVSLHIVDSLVPSVLYKPVLSVCRRDDVFTCCASTSRTTLVWVDRLTLTDAISVDEVFLDMDADCKYALVIQAFHTGDPIDLLRSRRIPVTEPYFVSLPMEERAAVKYLILT